MPPVRFRTLALVVSFLVAHAGAQVVRPQARVETALSVLRKAKTFDDEAIGYAGIKSDTYRAYEDVRDLMAAKDLLVLCDDKHPVVRCYAVRALADKHPDVDLLPVLLRHIADTQPIETMRGCIAAKRKTGDVMIAEARNRLSKAAQRELSERLVEARSKLDETNRVLRIERLSDKLYATLRSRAKAGDGPSLVALARYGREPDVDLIVARLNRRVSSFTDHFDALRAAEVSASPKLWPALVRLADQAAHKLETDVPARLRPWIEAVAAQRSKDAAKLLETFLQERTPKGFKRVQLAALLSTTLRNHTYPVYEPLLRRLWIDHGKLEPVVLEWLLVRRSEWTLARLRKLVATDLNSLDARVLPKAFEALFAADKSNAEALLAKALSAANVHRMRGLADLVIKWKPEGCIEPLFALVVSQTNPHYYLPAAEALLSYGRPKLRKRLQSLVQKHSHLQTGWGAQRLDKLLKG